jgi:hypothetical protein
MSQPDFEDSNLWRISAFNRMQLRTGSSGFGSLENRATVLPTTLLADISRMESDPKNADALEAMAACMRHREAALCVLQVDELVWPVTLFPVQMLYHSPRDLTTAAPAALANAKLLSIEPPGVKPPGHWMHERVAVAERYRPLVSMLWHFALHGPRRTLLTEISGTAAYRALSGPAEIPLNAPGAMGSAAERLRAESVAVREVASWPGMSLERASRLLNALYLSSRLLVSRAHPAARAQPEAGGTPRTPWWKPKR